MVEICMKQQTINYSKKNATIENNHWNMYEQQPLVLLRGMWQNNPIDKILRLELPLQITIKEVYGIIWWRLKHGWNRYDSKPLTILKNVTINKNHFEICMKQQIIGPTKRNLTKQPKRGYLKPAITNINNIKKLYAIIRWRLKPGWNRYEETNHWLY